MQATFLTPTSLRFDDVSSTVQFYSAGEHARLRARSPHVVTVHDACLCVAILCRVRFISLNNVRELDIAA